MKRNTRRGEYLLGLQKCKSASLPMDSKKKGYGAAEKPKKKFATEQSNRKQEICNGLYVHKCPYFQPEEKRRRQDDKQQEKRQKVSLSLRKLGIRI